MIKNYFTLGAFLLLGILTYGQETKRERKVSPIKSEATGTTGKGGVKESKTPLANEPQPVVADTLAGETIEHCDALILAIDNKVAHVKSDQYQNEKALATGWYDKMANNRAGYVARREALIARKQKQ